MHRNHAREVSSSRFQLQQVSANTRNTVVIDMGCQRCQHCMLHRLGPPAYVPARTPILDQAVPSVNPEQTGSQLCKE